MFNEFPDLSTYTPMGVALFIILMLGAALVWVCRRIITGQLISQRQHDELMKLAARARDDWKDTADARAAELAETREQNTLLLEAAKTTNAFMKTVGGDHVAQAQDRA